MNYFTNSILSLALIVSFQATHAQNPVIDSLENVVKNTKEDSVRIKTLNLLSTKLMRSGDYKKAMERASEAEVIISELLQSAEGKDQKRLKMYLADSYDNIGGILDGQGEYPEALENYIKAMKIYEEVGDKKGIGGCYNSIANIHLHQNNDKAALEAYFSSLKIAEEVGNRNGAATVYNNIALIYKDQKNYPEALKNHLISLEISKETGDKFGVGDSYSNIGTLYMGMEDYKEALKNYFEGLKILEELGAKKNVAGTYSNIGRVYSAMNENEKAIEYMSKGLKIAKEIGSKSYIRSIYAAMAETYAQMKNFEKAFEYHQLYAIIKDSILNERNSSQIAEMQAKYEAEKKDMELLKKDARILRDEVEAGKKSMQLNAVIVGFVLMILLATLIFMGYRRKKRDKEIIEEKQREILDSIHYAKKIQRSLLPTEKYIEKALKKLNNKS